jgi:integrase
MRQNDSGSDTAGNGDRRLAFSKRRLEALPVPQDRRLYYHDAATDGLTLCITPTGAKTFYFRKWVNGRASRIPLGKFPGMSVENARKAAQAYVGQIAKGIDPAVARQVTRNEPTFGDLWMHWVEHAKEHKKETSRREDERMHKLYLTPWDKRKLSAIRKADVQSLVRRIATGEGMEAKGKKKRGGRYIANRTHELIRAMFNIAEDIGYQGENPAEGIKRFREEKRDRFLHGEELRSFFRSLMQEQSKLLRDFFLVCLLCGARRGNVASMAWGDVDLDAGFWRIPETKSGKPVVVPLCAPALAILQTRHNSRNGSPWVFPGRGRTGHLAEPKGGWKRICQRAGLVDCRIHDLRRSLGSWQALTGASLPIIGKSLGHSQARTTEIYSRLTLDPVRASVETATTAMLTAGNLTIDVAGVKLLEQKEEGGKENATASLDGHRHNC